jgi:hypothetical protein
VSYQQKIHIQHARFTDQTFCGKPWTGSRGGRLASDTSPPVVYDDEAGSTNVATCAACILQLRRWLGPQAKP